MRRKAGKADMIWLAGAWLRSRGFPTAVVAGLLVAVAGALAGDVTLRLPYLQRSLPVPLVLITLTALVIATPLQSRFGDVERSFTRGTAERGVAGCLACFIAVAACVPASLRTAGAFPWRLLLALAAATVLAVVLVGPFAWLASLTLGLAAMYANLTRDGIVNTTLDDVGTTALVVTVLVALLVFAARGPASARAA